MLFEESELVEGGRVLLSRNDERSRHIRKVLKSQEGDRIKAGVVDGAAGTATVEVLGDKTTELRLTLDDERPLELYPITLLLAHPRPIVLRRMLKDLTTLGVGSLLILPGDRGEASYLDSSLWQEQRYRSHLVDGAMQAGSTAIPTVLRCADLTAALQVAEDRSAGIGHDRRPRGHVASEANQAHEATPADEATPAHEATPAPEAQPHPTRPNPPEAQPHPTRPNPPEAQPDPTSPALRIVADERAPVEESLEALLATERAERREAPVIGALGPERGWSDRERELFRRAGFRAVCLGERILRAETAAVVLTSALARLYVRY